MTNIFENYPDIVNVDQLCKMLNIGRNTAYRLLNSGTVKSVRIGRTHKILKASVISYVEQTSE